MGFEPSTPVFELVKKVHALDSAATVIGEKFLPPTRNRSPDVHSVAILTELSSYKEL
jgi:hypothetical protein